MDHKIPSYTGRYAPVIGVVGKWLWLCGGKFSLMLSFKLYPQLSRKPSLKLFLNLFLKPLFKLSFKPLFKLSFKLSSKLSTKFFLKLYILR